MDNQTIPDWNAFAELSAVKSRMFAAEQYKENVMVMYNEIVADPETDNNELTANFLRWCDHNDQLKLMFNIWLGGFEDRVNGPVTHIEILQFVNHLSMCEERQAVRLMTEGLKP